MVNIPKVLNIDIFWQFLSDVTRQSKILGIEISDTEREYHFIDIL